LRSLPVPARGSTAICADSVLKVEEKSKIIEIRVLFFANV
jgi:hypothetical protein